jgi:hypothetical protein
MRTKATIGRRVRVAGISIMVALLGVVLVAPSVDATIAPCTTPPTAFPIDQLAAGQHATGWTVLQGTTPESFDVEILGVITDAIAPGFDLILVKASGANIDAIGGMGPGFSGSPVYRNGELVGAVSYGLGGDPHYGALTPGQLMIDVLNNPSRSAASTRQTVHLSRSERRLIAADSRTSVSDVSSTLSQIPTPLAVAGATDERMAKAQKRLANEGVSVVPYRASSTSSSPQVSSGDPIVPGGVFTAAISYGAITYAGIGTATIACGDYVVAFGHPFRFTGSAPSSAALDGNVVTTVPAGGYYQEPFKIANVGALRGTVDQDRLAGIRGVIGPQPRLTEISSTVKNLDNGRVFDATTQIALPSWTKYLIWDHVYGALLTALDARRGTAWVTWTVRGRNEGERFKFDITNAYAGGRVLYGPAYDGYTILRTVENATGNAHITSVHVDATVTESHDYALIHKPRTQSTSAPGFKTQDTINVAAGDTLDVRVPVQQVDTGDTFIGAGSLQIPTKVRGSGNLEIYPGRGYFYIRNPGTLDQAIAKMDRVPRGFDLIIEARMRGANRVRMVVPTPYALKGEASPVKLHLIS